MDILCFQVKKVKLCVLPTVLENNVSNMKRLKFHKKIKWISNNIMSQFIIYM